MSVNQVFSCRYTAQKIDTMARNISERAEKIKGIYIDSLRENMSLKVSVFHCKNAN